MQGNYWDNAWIDSNFPQRGEKWIYLVAGSRNIDSVSIHGGLWANVGETKRSVEQRLLDIDYSRKCAGGDWIILNKWKVPVWISDSMIHNEIKLNKKILFRNSNNSEEFLFYDDSGNGNAASLIVAEAIVKVMKVESEKALVRLSVDRDILREKLIKLKNKKERIIGEKRGTSPEWK